MRVFDGDIFKVIYYSDEYIKHVRSKVTEIYYFVKSGHDKGLTNKKRIYIGDYEQVLLGDTVFILASKYTEDIESEKIIIFNDLESSDLSINSNKNINIISKNQSITILIRKGQSFIFAIDEQNSSRSSSRKMTEEKQILINVENNETIEVIKKEQIGRAHV